VIWTLLPALILILIAFPSLRLLYLSEENEISPVTMKIIGHQWYWSYEYSNFKEIEFDSFMKQARDSQFRLLETDNNFYLPEKIYTQLFISSTDVLHSWTIPSLRIKVDCSPGRLNRVNIYRNKGGTFFGQCSEICGANHSFIPITLQVMPFNLFKTLLAHLL
jgi:cytochrome c oxidase subunit 2